MSDKISQREARFLRKRVAELEAERNRMNNRWAMDYAPGWVHLATIALDPINASQVDIARKLKHAVILVNDDGCRVRMYAERLP